MPAFVGLLTIDLQIPGASTLKEKRSAVKSLRERLVRQFNASVAETEQLDDPRRATLAVACVSGDKQHLEKVLANVEAAACRDRDVIVEGDFVEIL